MKRASILGSWSSYRAVVKDDVRFGISFFFCVYIIEAIKCCVTVGLQKCIVDILKK